jgi:transcriptional regulator with XRE-family HTH domain
MDSAAIDHPLRKWRKRQGLTQDVCAAQVGTLRQVWSDWELGRSRPGKRLMPRVRALTGGEISADDFFPFGDSD